MKPLVALLTTTFALTACSAKSAELADAIKAKVEHCTTCEKEVRPPTRGRPYTTYTAHFKDFPGYDDLWVYYEEDVGSVVEVFGRDVLQGPKPYRLIFNLEQKTNNEYELIILNDVTGDFVLDNAYRGTGQTLQKANEDLSTKVIFHKNALDPTTEGKESYEKLYKDILSWIKR